MESCVFVGRDKQGETGDADIPCPTGVPAPARPKRRGYPGSDIILRMPPGAFCPGGAPEVRPLKTVGAGKRPPQERRRAERQRRYRRRVRAPDSSLTRSPRVLTSGTRPFGSGIVPAAARGSEHAPRTVEPVEPDRAKRDDRNCRQTYPHFRQSERPRRGRICGSRSCRATVQGEDTPPLAPPHIPRPCRRNSETVFDSRMNLARFLGAQRPGPHRIGKASQGVRPIQASRSCAPPVRPFA